MGGAQPGQENRNGGAAPRKTQSLFRAMEIRTCSDEKGPAQGQLVPIAREKTRMEVRTPDLHRGGKGVERQGWQVGRRGSGKRASKRQGGRQVGATAVQTVAKLYNEYVDHIGPETKDCTAMMRWVDRDTFQFVAVP